MTTLDYEPAEPLSHVGPGVLAARWLSAALFTASLALFGKWCRLSWGFGWPPVGAWWLLMLLLLPVLLALYVYLPVAALLGVVATLAAGRTNRFAAPFRPGSLVPLVLSSGLAVFMLLVVSPRDLASEMWAAANLLCFAA